MRVFRYLTTIACGCRILTVFIEPRVVACRTCLANFFEARAVFEAPGGRERRSWHRDVWMLSRTMLSRRRVVRRRRKWKYSDTQNAASFNTNMNYQQGRNIVWVVDEITQIGLPDKIFRSNARTRQLPMASEASGDDARGNKSRGAGCTVRRTECNNEFGVRHTLIRRFVFLLLLLVRYSSIKRTSISE